MRKSSLTSMAWGLLLAATLLCGACGGTSSSGGQVDANQDAGADTPGGPPDVALRDLSGGPDQVGNPDSRLLDVLFPDVSGQDGAAAVDIGTADVPSDLPFGAACRDNGECASGWCLEFERGYVCTSDCGDGCPEGWACVPVFNTAPDYQYVCKPAEFVLCDACESDGDCGDGFCLTMGDGERRCTGTCVAERTCPDGYTCDIVQSEDEPTLSSYQCLPESGVCDCGPANHGATRPCARENEHGSCWGLETCDESVGWTGCSADTPAAELCDGVDQNCDGRADEDAVPPGEPCAVDNEHGLCSGDWLCRGAEGWLCTAETPAAETCDYRDEDCDGETDEDYRDPTTGAYVTGEHCGACGNDCTRAYPNAESVCDDSLERPSCAIERCEEGSYRAGEFVCAPVATSQCTPCADDSGCPVPGDRCVSLAGGATACAHGCGLDAPRDGCPEGTACETLDDGAPVCLPTTGACDCYRPDHDGATRACVLENELGACTGSQACDPTSGWTDCSAAPPQPESCNGLDDDCDGRIDEDVPPPETPCEVENGQGRCAGAWRCPAEAATTGWVCDAPTPAEDVCDYRDNDCDGETDEDFRDAAGDYVTPDHCGVCGYSCAVAIPFAAEARCVLEDGVPRCEAVSCEEGYYLSVEGNVCVPFVGTDDCAPCAEDAQCASLPGQCVDVDGGRHCLRPCGESGGDEPRCPVGYACAELDGDELCLPTAGSCSCRLAEQAGAARACVRSNEFGACTGVQTCLGEEGWTACSAEEPAEEICNGYDDDCDGDIDGDVTPPAEACVNENEFGRCEQPWRCEEGSDGRVGWLCGAGTPQAELCDYVDNDCDGETDEDFRVGGAGVYVHDDHCGVCGYGCRQAIPFSAEASCVLGTGEPRCTVETCEPGYFQPSGLDICAPFGAANDCAPCSDDEQCAGLPGRCVAVDSGTFCLRTCDSSEDCPGAYDCEDGLCVPHSASCSCLPGMESAQRACHIANAYGVCAGTQYCGGVDGWSACDASVAGLETCNGVDDDCDGQVDEEGAQGCVVYQRDVDLDGYGDGAWVQCLCAPRDFYRTEQGGDCDDGDPDVSPEATETCNGVDDDCDGIADERDAAGCETYYRDEDGDGWGVDGSGRCLCAAAYPYTASAPGDCDDGDSHVAPGATETCDGRDDDCDGTVDEAGAEGCTLHWADGDADGWGAEGSELCTCGPQLERPADVGGDCADGDPDVNPGATEVCGGGDDDCDGVADGEGAEGCVVLFPDRDGDGYGEPYAARCLCGAQGDYTATVGGDCDDDDPTWIPGADESCDVDGDCCLPDAVCRYGLCVPGPAACDTSDNCLGDAWCDGGECIPWGVGPGGESDPACVRPSTPGLFRPSVQCTWDGPPAGDPYPNHRNVLSTAVVADFDLDGDPATVQPSIVFTSYNYTDGGDLASDGGGASSSYYGIVRVLDGATCEQQFNVDVRRVVGSNPLALGDIDGDGRPEIVAHGVGGGLLVFRYDEATDDFGLLWESHTAAGAVHRPYARVNRWGGPSITDLDGDARPEIVMATYVYDADGVLRAGNLGLHMYSRGHLPVVADVDRDGAPELVTGDGVWRYQDDGGGSFSWQRESYNGPSTDGFVAIGDFGDFPVDGLPDDIPEIVVISSGIARVMDLSGQTVFGPYELPFFPPATNRGTGGQPTVGDFDNDGRPEFALAGRGAYTIFDLDCQGNPMPTGCWQEGILWSLPSQDYSSSMTGSSIFDFEGDGFAEGVYSDECFTRVYRGVDGEVLFSQWRSSCTWYENPVIADVDGDGYTEIVMGSNTNCDKGTKCQALDPYFRGLRCESAEQCPSGSCVSGFCRCTTDADCGGTDFVCADPIANTPGAGQVCRASHPRVNWGGLRVYQDTLDNWVNSRPIWNQHAYFVTNVEDDGTIPPFGESRGNWSDPGLNNFRQNVQGSLDPTLAPDFTVRALPAGNCDAAGVLELFLEVCNRGAAEREGELALAVWEGAAGTGSLVAAPTVASPPGPGSCVAVAASWALSAPETPTDVTVTVDLAGDFRECWEENNAAVLRDVTCTNLP